MSKEFANIVPLMVFQKSAFNPTDGTTYFFGPNEAALTFFSFAFFGFSVSRKAIATDFIMTTHVNGTQGSLEPAVLSLMQYMPVRGQLWHGSGIATPPAKTNEYPIHRNIVFNDTVAPTQSIKNLSIQLSPGYIYLYKIACPTYATNPTNIYMNQVGLFGYFLDTEIL